MTNFPPPNVGNSMFNTCWNCGNDAASVFCPQCGTNISQKPQVLVDSQKAAIDGAIAGAAISAIFSDDKHRLRNSALGAIWGFNTANSEAESLNSAFTSGAPVSAISAHQARRLKYLLGRTICWIAVLIATFASAVPGVALISVPMTWYTFKQLARLQIWQDQPWIALALNVLVS